MSKDILTDSFTWEFQLGTAVSVTLNGTQGRSISSKINGEVALTESASFNVTGYTGGAINVAGSGATTQPVTLIATAQYTKADSEKVLLDGDRAEVVLQGSNSSSGTVTQPDVLILHASQHVVKGT